MNCGMYMVVRLLRHTMKFFNKVLEKGLRIIVSIDDMYFGFIPGEGTIDAIIISRRLQKNT